MESDAELVNLFLLSVLQELWGIYEKLHNRMNCFITKKKSKIEKWLAKLSIRSLRFQIFIWLESGASNVSIVEYRSRECEDADIFPFARLFPSVPNKK